jgi:hypothetical protein
MKQVLEMSKQVAVVHGQAKFPAVHGQANKNSEFDEELKQALEMSKQVVVVHGQAKVPVLHGQAKFRVVYAIAA